MGITEYYCSCKGHHLGRGGAGWVPPSVSSRSVEEEEQAGQATFVPDAHEDSASDQSDSGPAESESGHDGEGSTEVQPHTEDGAGT